jgi:hypothetical protein
MTSFPFLEFLAAHPGPYPSNWLVDVDSVDVASRHGLVGLLHDEVRAQKLICAPDALEHLRQRALYSTANSARAHQLLLNSVDALKAANVRVMPLKGTYLAQRVYPQWQSRFTSDVDLLVPVEQLPAAEGALVRMGLRRRPGAEEEVHRRNHHHLVLEQALQPSSCIFT